MKEKKKKKKFKVLKLSEGLQQHKSYILPQSNCFPYLAIIDTLKDVIDVGSYFSCCFTHTDSQTFLKDSKQYKAVL